MGAQTRQCIPQTLIMLLLLPWLLLGAGCVRQRVPGETTPKPRQETRSQATPNSIPRSSPRAQSTQRTPVTPPTPLVSKPLVASQPPSVRQSPVTPPPAVTPRATVVQQSDGKLEYMAQLHKLTALRTEIEAKGYILDEANRPTILKREPLRTYEGHRMTLHAMEKRYLLAFEQAIEAELELQFSHNFRRVFRGSMSNPQKGVYVIDFIPQKNLKEYKKQELQLQ